MFYPLARDIPRDALDRPENPSLWWSKYVPWDGNPGAPKQIEKNCKKKFLQSLGNGGKACRPCLEAYAGRLEAQLHAYRGMGFHLEIALLKTEWRMVVGLGSESVLETSMTLHRLYGFPYIPGSAVKGITRAYAELELGDPHPDLKTVFGSESKDERTVDTHQVGDVIFFDAVPTAFRALDLDIMNPHYPDYYRDQGGAPPGDWQNPNPILFLAVAPDTEFRFGLASRNESSLRRAGQWLKEGLNHLGIGAKTSAGYGYFQIPEPQPASSGETILSESRPVGDPEMERVENLIRPLESIPPSHLAGRIGHFIAEWRNFDPESDAALRLARAIVGRVDSLPGKQARNFRKKPWYNEIKRTLP